MIVKDYDELELKPNPQRKICTLTVGAIEIDGLHLEEVFLFSIPILVDLGIFHEVQSG